MKMVFGIDLLKILIVYVDGTHLYFALFFVALATEKPKETMVFYQ